MPVLYVKMPHGGTLWARCGEVCRRRKFHKFQNDCDAGNDCNAFDDCNDCDDCHDCDDCPLRFNLSRWGYARPPVFKFCPNRLSASFASANCQHRLPQLAVCKFCLNRSSAFFAPTGCQQILPQPACIGWHRCVDPLIGAIGWPLRNGPIGRHPWLAPLCAPIGWIHWMDTLDGSKSRQIVPNRYMSLQITPSRSRSLHIAPSLSLIHI